MMKKRIALRASFWSFPSLVFAGCLVVLPARAQDCAPATWLRLAGDRPAAAAPADLIADMAARDVVLLGEHHDVADHHHWQLHTLAALHARRAGHGIVVPASSDIQTMDDLVAKLKAMGVHS